MTSQEHSSAAYGKNFRRTFTLSFGMGTVVAFLLVLSVGLVSVFCLGIFLGRGYSPEDAFPGLARLMPEPAPAAAPMIVAGDAPAPPEAQPQPSPPPQQALPANAGQAGQQPPPAPPRATAPAQTPPPPATAARPQQPPQQQTRPQQPETTPPAESASGERFLFVYQVASYKTADPCNALVAKLKNAGFSARVQKHEDADNTWYRAVVDFSGNTRDAEKFKERLKNSGAPGIFLKSKKPVR